jgi:chromosome segregation ATPase
MSPPAKKTAKKSSKAKIPPKSRLKDEEKENLNSVKKKMDLISRNLLRLYQFLSEDRPIKQEDLLNELELNTPNEQLRNQISNTKLELESIYEENQALRENALQNQIEFDDYISTYQLENKDLQENIKNSDKKHQEKAQIIIDEYEEKISNLRTELNLAVERNQKITEVNEAIEMLQEKAKDLFRKKESLIKKNRSLSKQLEEKDQNIKEIENEKQFLMEKQQKLEKKIELQTMVISGYKRKEKG